MASVKWYGFIVDPRNLPEARAGLYQLINLTNGKSYFGISMNVKRRCQGHAASLKKKGRSTRLVSALKYYGLANFLVMPLCYAAAKGGDQTDWLLELEANLIAEHGTTVAGYNIIQDSSPSGNRGPEFLKRIMEARPSEARAVTMREFAQRQWSDPVSRQHMLDVAADPKLRARRSASLIASFAAPGGKDKLLASHTEEWLKKQRTAGKARFQTEADFQRARDAQARVAGQHAASLVEAWAKNPRVWITNGADNRHHFAKDPIPAGWSRGRYMPLRGPYKRKEI